MALVELSQDTQWEEFVRQFSSRMLEDAADGKHYGCPFAVVGMEIAFAEPDISPHYAVALEKVAALFRCVLEQSGIPSSYSATLADRLFSIYEGELLRYRISKDPVYIKNLETQLIGTYRIPQNSFYIRGDTMSRSSFAQAIYENSPVLRIR